MKYIKTLFLYLKESAITGKSPDEMGLPYANTLASNVNVKEIPSGSNRSPEIDRYFDLVGLDNRKKGNSGYPWCAAFVYAMFDDFCKKVGLANPLIKTAGVQKHWNKADSTLKISAAEARQDPNLVKPGQVFIMLYGGGKGHTGIVTSVNTKNKTFTTIEGNTNDSKSREGHRVGRNTRKMSDSKLAGFIDYFKGNRNEKFETTLADVVANASTDYSPTEASKDSYLSKDNITIAQKKLKSLGYDLGAYGPNKDGVDGSMGKMTKTALIDFQKNNGLKQSGTLDEDTFLKLGGTKINNTIKKEVYSGTKKSVPSSHSTVSIPINVTGPVPVFIFYPGIPVGGKIGKDYMPPIIQNAVPSWYNNYIIAVPNSHTTSYDNVVSDINNAIKKVNPSISIGSINIGIFSGSGNNSADISKKIMSIKPLNLILMDPTPGLNLINSISSATNVYMMYNPSNWGSAKYYVNSIGDLENAIQTVNGVLDKVKTSHMKIPADMLKKYMGNIQSSLNKPSIKQNKTNTVPINNPVNSVNSETPYVQSYTDFA